MTDAARIEAALLADRSWYIGVFDGDTLGETCQRIAAVLAAVSSQPAALSCGHAREQSHDEMWPDGSETTWCRACQDHARVVSGHDDVPLLLTHLRYAVSWFDRETLAEFARDALGGYIVQEAQTQRVHEATRVSSA